MKKFPKWLAGMGLIAVLVPVALIARGVMYVFRFDDPTGRTPEEVSNYLRKFMDGTEGEWDLDDFDNVPIKDERLDSIRREFLSIRLPMDDAGRAKAQELLSKVDGTARKELEIRMPQPPR
jgi:hypothetical protein